MAVYRYYLWCISATCNPLCVLWNPCLHFGISLTNKCIHHLFKLYYSCKKQELDVYFKLEAGADPQVGNRVHRTPRKKKFICIMTFFHHTCTPQKYILCVGAPSRNPGFKCSSSAPDWKGRLEPNYSIPTFQNIHWLIILSISVASWHSF